MRHPSGHILSQQPITQRVLLYPGELYHVPAVAHHVQFTAGRAWVSYHGQDMIVNANERVTFTDHDTALISPLGQNPLVIELVSGE
jgi:hypothetical protein